MATAPTITQPATTLIDSSSVKEPKPVNPKHPQSLHPVSKASSSLSPLNFTSGGGTRSPSASMPSSPTSIHSTSSAIFERDIEQPLSATTSLATVHKDPHHTARAAAHEPLESAVPSVLSAAVAVLGEIDSNAGSPTHEDGTKKGMSMDEISVIAPSPLSPANWTSPSGSSIRHGISRSPSPSPNVIPLPSTSPTPSRISRSGLPHRLNTGGDGSTADIANASTTAVRGSTPNVIGIVPPTPNVNNFGFSRTAGSSPQSATASPMILTPPLPGPIPRPSASNPSASRSTSRPTSIAMSLEELSLSPLVATTADSDVPVPAGVEPLALSGNPHHRSPSPNAANNAKNRLSFISYNDLLNSTPISSYSFGTVTNAGASVEPPHQIDVTVRETNRSRTASRQSTINRSPVSDVFGGSGGGSPPAPSVLGAIESEPPSHLHSHDVGPKGGGEWQRGGFGTGMEERVESTMKEQQAPSIRSDGSATANH